jgi:hypothetical protein
VYIAAIIGGLWRGVRDGTLLDWAAVLRPCTCADEQAVTELAREDPRAGGQLGRHIDHLLTAGGQSGRDVPAVPWQPSIAQICAGHRRTPANIAAYPAASVPYRPPPRTISSAAMTSIVAERLCGSIPITTVPICSSCPLLAVMARARRAPLLRAEQTPWTGAWRGSV